MILNLKLKNYSERVVRKEDILKEIMDLFKAIYNDELDISLLKEDSIDNLKEVFNKTQTRQTD